MIVNLIEELIITKNIQCILVTQFLIVFSMSYWKFEINIQITHKIFDWILKLQNQFKLYFEWQKWFFLIRVLLIYICNKMHLHELHEIILFEKAKLLAFFFIFFYFIKSSIQNLMTKFSILFCKKKDILKQYLTKFLLGKV